MNFGNKFILWGILSCLFVTENKESDQHSFSEFGKSDEVSTDFRI